MKWNVFDADGNWLGTIHGANEAAAIENAKKMDMPGAVRVEPRDLPIYRGEE